MHSTRIFVEWLLYLLGSTLREGDDSTFFFFWSIFKVVIALQIVLILSPAVKWMLKEETQVYHIIKMCVHGQGSGEKHIWMRPKKSGQEEGGKIIRKERQAESFKEKNSCSQMHWRGFLKKEPKLSLEYENQNSLIYTNIFCCLKTHIGVFRGDVSL